MKNLRTSPLSSLSFTCLFSLLALLTCIAPAANAASISSNGTGGGTVPTGADAVTITSISGGTISFTPALTVDTTGWNAAYGNGVMRLLIQDGIVRRIA